MTRASTETFRFEVTRVSGEESSLKDRASASPGRRIMCAEIVPELSSKETKTSKNGLSSRCHPSGSIPYYCRLLPPRPIAKSLEVALFLLDVKRRNLTSILIRQSGPEVRLWKVSPGRYRETPKC